jgi:indolepyruvate ferredoxin oxidoreductase
LIRAFERRIDEIVAQLSAENHPLAVGLATIPQKIRGFGHIKDRNLKTAQAEEEQLLAQFRSKPEQPLPLAAE